MDSARLAPHSARVIAVQQRRFRRAGSGDEVDMSRVRWTVLRSCSVMALCLVFACGAENSPQDMAARAPSRSAVSGTALESADGGVCGRSDSHARHASSGIQCAVCHPCGGQLGFSAYAYPQGTSIDGGTITPATATSPATCAVACHSPLGAPAHTVAWTAGTLACNACHETIPPPHPAVPAGATRDDCQACHDTSRHTGGTVSLVGHPRAWMSEGDPGFHAFAAERGLAACQQCHRADLSGGATGFACARCHDVAGADGGTIAWQTNCTLCHGGAENASGAPPRNIWGYTADAVRTGAHSTHLAGSDIAPPLPCEVCHVKPADALAPGHIDSVASGAVPMATVTFGGLAALGTTPAWDRDAATCRNTFCHGATLPGGTLKAPVWTGVGQGQAACGTCHGSPPPSPHPYQGNDLTRCSGCHSFTMSPSGAVIPPSAGGKHLDGLVQATSGHDLSWTDPLSPGFHAFAADSNILNCTVCHGGDLTGGFAGVACANCHDRNLPPGVASWKVNCVMCHGGADNKSGAPPRATWGNAGDPLRTGAHSAHVAGPWAAPFDCSACHPKPSDALSPGHIDQGTATVAFGGVALNGGAAPSWRRADGTCSSTYCHGNYSGVYAYSSWDWSLDQPVTAYAYYQGKNGTPAWTGAPATCDSCHGNPPWTRETGAVWHSGHHGGGNDCQLCHPDATGVNGAGTAITDPSLHVNGAIDVRPQWRTSCIGCH
jgi:predicted CxxxxCH...CXXCH cytochrome family protein